VKKLKVKGQKSIKHKKIRRAVPRGTETTIEAVAISQKKKCAGKIFKVYTKK
jgi:hypothetical protein